MAAPQIDPIEQSERRPLRRVEYDQLIALGAFEDERIELLDGELVQMSPPGPPHTETVARLCERLILALTGRARVFCQSPFAANEYSEPEPDLMLLPVQSDGKALPERAYLLIEVSESSLAKDRGKKARIYAEAGVPEYWIFNLVARQVEVHRQPSPGGYQEITRHGASAEIAPLAYPDVELRVDDFWP